MRTCHPPCTSPMSEPHLIAVCVISQGLCVCLLHMQGGPGEYGGEFCAVTLLLTLHSSGLLS